MNKKEKKQILLNTLANEVKKCIPEGKAPTTLSAEYGLSSSIMSKLLKGVKDPQFTTLYLLSEMLNMKISTLMELIVENVPEDFTMIDI